MTSLLSSISGQFGKPMILGSLFPVLILSILNVVVVAPLLPAMSAIQAKLTRVAIGEEKWAAVTLGFVVLVLTGLLYNLNISIIRLYEGYPWRLSWIGALFTWPKKKCFRAAVPLRLSLRYLRREWGKLDPHSQQARSLGGQQTELALFINSELPDREEFILPTRLGNVIRCFERYPAVAYGMDAIVLWPRLISKIDSSFGSSIDDAKTSFDFMLNCSFLSTLTTVGIVGIGLFYPVPLTVASTVPWIWRALLFAALAVIFYRFSIGRAAAWGMQVKAAFDLYRFELLKALGYQQQPQTFFEEQALWQRISAQLLYADTRERPLPYRAPTTRVVASPKGVQLEVKKELTLIAVNGHVEVRITVQNNDSRTADTVVLVETLPEGYKYVLQSARGSAGPIRVANLNPIELAVTPILPGAVLTVTYTIQRATG
jgi:uncharacterized repeat protein (TIGR01451 family)